MCWDETDDHDFSDSELEYYSEPLQRKCSCNWVKKVDDNGMHHNVPISTGCCEVHGSNSKI